MRHDDCPGPDELLRLARADDGPALGQLLERCRGYLTLLARVQVGRRLQGKVEASDLVQDVFLEVQQTFDRFRGGTEAEFLGWVRRILASRAAMAVRRYCGTRGRNVRLERRLADEVDQSSQAIGFALADRHSSPSQRAVRREQAVLVAAALEALPDDYRDVIVLRHLEGLTFPEVARRLGRTVPSVKNVWIRALALLRRSLGDEP
jgi:RNA polymerase sigma-70 factor (ECF subfamily)